jgi:hypothetical protein
MTTESNTPNLSEAVREQTAEPVSDASIFAKMTAMRETTQRNQLRAAESTASGDESAAQDDSPVAPDEPRITSQEDHDIDRYAEESAPEASEQEEPVSEAPDANSTADELIDFIEFAETNPKAKFKFLRDGKEVVIDARKAASILGQGGAIHEEARQLKVERADFEDYLKQQREHHDGLTLAMEFTVAPKLQHAYDEILKTQGYNQVFYEQLQRTQDPTLQAQIQANIQQNDRYMQQQGNMIKQIKPNVDRFRTMRREQVAGLLEQSRKGFKDKELRNEYVFNELRDKLSKTWDNATGEALPGIKNLDLVTSDETILALLRDGLKYRDRPAAKQAGNSIAALTRRAGASTTGGRNTDGDIAKLREQAKQGGKEGIRAADNLLTLQLSKLRAGRTGR